jgi:hypothetical protein
MTSIDRIILINAATYRKSVFFCLLPYGLESQFCNILYMKFTVYLLSCVALKGHCHEQIVSKSLWGCVGP